MAFHYENLKLEKGMYGQSGRSFAQTLEALDPSENYKGTSLEGLDAFQRQLKRFDIKVKGAGSDKVEKFFWSTESAVLFPEFVSRVVRQGMEEESILPDITATVTHFDGLDYRSIASTPTEEEKKLKRVEEGAQIPQTTIHTQENLGRLHKRGRMLVAPYEAIRFQRLDLFAVTLRQIGAYIGRMHLEDAVKVLKDGDGNNNAAASYEVGTSPIGGTKSSLSYGALLDFWAQFDPYTMNTALLSGKMTAAMREPHPDGQRAGRKQRVRFPEADGFCRKNLHRKAGGYPVGHCAAVRGDAEQPDRRQPADQKSESHLSRK